MKIVACSCFVLLGLFLSPPAPAQSRSLPPHVQRCDGKYWTEPGYVVDDPKSAAVKWAPGIQYRSCGNVTQPHIMADKREGYWTPEPGYKWAHLDANGKPTDFAVQWEPEQHLPTWPHVHAGQAEGSYSPDNGYTWAHLDKDGHPTDAAVRSLTPAELAEEACEKAMHRPMDVPVALRACNTSVNRYPKEWQGYLDRAYLRMRLDQFDGAKADLDHANQLVNTALSSGTEAGEAKHGADAIRKAKESLELSKTLEPLWVAYLRELEAAGPAAWENWRAAPWSLYRKNHQAAEGQVQARRLNGVVQ